jgi:methyl-accepting chemotaxis protein
MFGKSKNEIRLEEENKNLKIEIENLKKGTDATEIINVIDSVAKGVMLKKVEGNFNGELNQVKVSVNKLIDTLLATFKGINDSLYSLGCSDFTARIETKTIGSVASVISGVNTLSNNMEVVFTTLSNTEKEISVEIEGLRELTSQLSQNSNSQATHLEETAASVEEISGNITENTDKTKEMAKKAEESLKEAQVGKRTLSETTSKMNEINTIQNNISKAIEQIDQIAFQTNILSLNAAVEAATAGEHGKGFAVVAQEVRNLAARSAEAAEDIKKLVNDSLGKAEEGAKSINMLGNSFEGIINKIEETAELVESVSSASIEQETGITQISAAMSELDSTTQENAAAADRVNEVANIINEKVKVLDDLVSHSKFNHQPEVKNIELLFTTNKLKFDHLKFKETAMSNIFNKKYDVLADHRSCGLGKAVSKWQSEGQDWVSGNEFNGFDLEHSKVHKLGNEMIKHSKETNNETDLYLEKHLQNIDLATKGVFRGLNIIKNK